MGCASPSQWHEANYAWFVGQLQPYEEQVASLMRDEARALLEGGRATIDVTPAEGERPTMCELRPKNDAASPFVVQVDSPQQLTVYLGRFGTVLELYDGKRDALLSELAEYLRAVVAGRYRESVRLIDGELAKARGVLKLDGVEARIFSSRPATIGRRGPWQALSYEPY